MKLKDRLSRIDNDYPCFDENFLLDFTPDVSASFVIPSYNSASSIPYVLKSIESQKLRSRINEVIIIDDNSTDKSQDIINEYKRNSNLNIINIQNTKRSFAAYSRNKGVDEATGDIICFIDSDIVVPPDYLDYHLALHSHFENVISLSLRSFIEFEKISFEKLEFPISNYRNEFRVEKLIKSEWCDTPERKPFSEKKIRLIEETKHFRDLGHSQSHFWTLPEVCLGSSICYKRKDVLQVNGVPENFIGWGFNDAVLAAKIIALQRYVIPLISCGVYHVIHPRRSGSKRDLEYSANKKKYFHLLELDELDARQNCITELDG